MVGPDRWLVVRIVQSLRSSFNPFLPSFLLIKKDHTHTRIPIHGQTHLQLEHVPLMLDGVRDDGRDGDLALEVRHACRMCRGGGGEKFGLVEGTTGWEEPGFA